MYRLAGGRRTVYGLHRLVLLLALVPALVLVRPPSPPGGVQLPSGNLLLDPYAASEQGTCVSRAEVSLAR